MPNQTMKETIWIEESTWEACVDQAREVVPADADVMLMHVAPIDVEELAGGGGLLGRHPAPPPGPAVRALAAEEAQALLAAAQERFARPARVESGPAIDTIRLPPHLRG